ncbi:2TM domain-containing protein [Hanstruepera marina]|uniref:2TM domain-containing protein n=1 Tax=Hanstruepera marina TaxID=2873265 RepID=UPI001CA7872E|nr:2TM domain-containing protein [Hanstruepera marina]
MEQDLYKPYHLDKAERRVKEIKSFYVHVFIYLVSNLVWIMILLYYNEMSSYTQYGFWGKGYGQVPMAVLWGVGILIHWFLVFGKNISFSKKWESRKIKQLLDKENQYWE